MTLILSCCLVTGRSDICSNNSSTGVPNEVASGCRHNLLFVFIRLCFTAVWAELEPQRRTLRMTCAWCSLPSGLCQTESCDVLPWGQLGQILFLLGFIACYQDPLRAHKCVSKSSRLSTLQTQLRIVFLPSVQWLDEQPVWRRWSRLRRWSHSVVHKWCGIIQDPLGLKNKW